jgi:hypothetical protein
VGVLSKSLASGGFFNPPVETTSGLNLLDGIIECKSYGAGHVAGVLCNSKYDSNSHMWMSVAHSDGGYRIFDATAFVDRFTIDSNGSNSSNMSITSCGCVLKREGSQLLH